MNKKNINRGFTLIEMIIAVAIIAALTAVAVPSYAKVLGKAKQEADNTSVVTLNNATIAYANMNEIAADIFTGISNDIARIQHLVEKQYLSGVVETQQKDVSFEWIIDDQAWTISGETGFKEKDKEKEKETNLEKKEDISKYPAWDSSSIYSKANTYVVYKDKVYFNKWWVNGSTLPGTNQVWQQVSDEWVQLNIYIAGDTTYYKNQQYKAKYWTSGKIPADSAYGPWELVK